MPGEREAERLDSEIRRSFGPGFGTGLVADNSVLPSPARRSGCFPPGEPGSRTASVEKSARELNPVTENRAGILRDVPAELP